jgi:hypothetical protein
MDLQTPHRPPVADGVAASPNPNQSLKPRRRAESPPPTAHTTDARPKRRSPNYVHKQTASPAVISSLIDQLSAISIPANDHFENLLVGYSNGLSTSTRTSIHSTRNSTAGHDGSSFDHSALSLSLKEQNEAFPDDACEPPVIRTSKPPSGFSPLTAPKKKDKPHSLSSYIGRNSGSSASLHSTHSNQSVVSFGTISIEAGPPRPSVSSERSSIESKRSIKGHRGLMYMSSRERLKMKETERKRHTTHSSAEDVLSHDSPRKGSVALFSYEDTIKEEPTSREENRPFQAEASRFAQMHPDSSRSPRRLRINLVDGLDNLSPSNAAIIPERGSSLRHSGSPTRKSKKSRASGANRKEQPKAEKPETVVEEKKTVEEFEPVDEEIVMKDKILQELEQEENEVAHRIRVLKEQKLQRDRIAGIGNGAAGVPTSSMPQVSAIPSPEASPTSVVSSASGDRVPDPAKAHKVLGITRKELSTNSPVVTEKAIHKSVVRKPAPGPIAIPQDQAQAMHYAKHPGNDGEEFTQLPINYNVAMARLLEMSPPTPTKEGPTREGPTREPTKREAPAREPTKRETHTRPPTGREAPPKETTMREANQRETRSPPPPSLSVASSKDSQSITTRPRRSSSVVGGRSAVSRKATASSLLGANLGHQHSSSINNETVSLSALSAKQTHRSVSTEMGVRSHSMMLPLPDSNSLQLQRRKTFTKKRWSHPDLPAKAEKRHNERVERAEAAADSGALGIGAVQRPPRSVVEERPASLDPIDVEVDSFLNSPRLSQKIRHPQTGRIISYSDVGDPNGFAVFVCVGMGLTRYVMTFYDQLAVTLKLRLITPDRPGVGGSQIDPTGTPLSWPGELETILFSSVVLISFQMMFS